METLSAQGDAPSGSVISSVMTPSEAITYQVVYCRHCEDEYQAIPVEGDFLLTLLCHLDQEVLAHVQDSLREDINGNCDACGGERSRQLLDLLLKAKVVTGSHRPRIVISIF
jgi:hypothetical protein